MLDSQTTCHFGLFVYEFSYFFSLLPLFYNIQTKIFSFVNAWSNPLKQLNSFSYGQCMNELVPSEITKSIHYYHTQYSKHNLGLCIYVIYIHFAEFIFSFV